MTSKKDSEWSEDQLLLALNLYFNTIPEERNAKNKKILELATFVNRSAASIVYRLGNYSAVDPKATGKEKPDAVRGEGLAFSP